MARERCVFGRRDVGRRATPPQHDVVEVRDDVEEPAGGGAGYAVRSTAGTADAASSQRASSRVGRVVEGEAVDVVQAADDVVERVRVEQPGELVLGPGT